MTFHIKGFGDTQTASAVTVQAELQQKITIPKKSLVKVRFPEKGMALTYYNDQFDLKVGDRVYVDGKLEGLQGRITEITYNFKIKISDYQKVIALVDTDVHGQFYMAGSHFVTFDSVALPPEQVSLWFKAPAKEEEIVVSGTDDSSFSLEDLSGMKISKEIAQRGHDYYLENRVVYLRLQGCRGYAIVEGSQAYAVEFCYQDGQISQLLCECPCCCRCKHEFAAMLQLQETLELINKHYLKDFTESSHVTAISKGVLFSFAIDGKEHGSFQI